MAIGRNGRGGRSDREPTITRIDIPPGTDIDKFIRGLMKEMDEAGWERIDENDPKFAKIFGDLPGMPTSTKSKKGLGFDAPKTKKKVKTKTKASVKPKLKKAKKK